MKFDLHRSLALTAILLNVSYGG